MSNLQNVTLKMKDELTGEMVSRTIDITNAMSNSYPCYELKDEESQRKELNNWINERGNKQHDTILTLESWIFS